MTTRYTEKVAAFEDEILEAAQIKSASERSLQVTRILRRIANSGFDRRLVDYLMLRIEDSCPYSIGLLQRQMLENCCVDDSERCVDDVERELINYLSIAEHVEVGDQRTHTTRRRHFFNDFSTWSKKNSPKGFHCGVQQFYKTIGSSQRIRKFGLRLGTDAGGNDVVRGVQLLDDEL